MFCSVLLTTTNDLQYDIALHVTLVNQTGDTLQVRVLIVAFLAPLPLSFALLSLSRLCWPVFVFVTLRMCIAERGPLSLSLFAFLSLCRLCWPVFV